MLAALASLALSLVSPAERTEPAATPALYSVRDSDTTIFIFGTFHVLDPSIRWFEGPVEQAFDRADELVVETLPPGLEVNAREAATAVLEPALPAASFLATSRAAVHAGRDQGMRLEHGADMVLLRSASAWGKAIEPLETLQSQYAMLVRIPVAGGPSGPAATPMSATPKNAEDELSATMTRMQAAWAARDQGVFAAMVSRMRATTPEAYRVMFAERNARWTDWIAARMREPGVVFVAVGAGHLAGPESLLVRLAQRGIVSRRITGSD